MSIGLALSFLMLLQASEVFPKDRGGITRYIVEEEGIPRFSERTRRWKEVERERWTRWR